MNGSAANFPSGSDQSQLFVNSESGKLQGIGDGKAGPGLRLRRPGRGGQSVTNVASPEISMSRPSSNLPSLSVSSMTSTLPTMDGNRSAGRDAK
ncbi:hypothetical protein SAFG77S_05282 [Streptomyces afghaniensis]|jgi:hypothetical protein